MKAAKVVIFLLLVACGIVARYFVGYHPHDVAQDAVVVAPQDAVVVAPQHHQPAVFAGIKLGVPVKQSLPVCTERSTEVCWESDNPEVIFSIRNTPFNPTMAHEINGVVGEIEASFLTEDWDTVAQALVQKFGPPTDKTTDGGVEELRWKMPAFEITAASQSSDDGIRGNVHVLTDAAIKSSHDYEQSEANRIAGKL